MKAVPHHKKGAGDQGHPRQIVPQFCTQDYGTGRRLVEAQAFASKRLSEIAARRAAAAPSYTVVGSRNVISNKAGLTGDEIRLASEAAHYIAGLGFRLWYAVLADRYSDERENRRRIRDFKSDLARAQRRAGLTACCYIEILEGCPAVHSNILFPLDGPNADRLVAGLLRSAKFQGGELDIQEAGDANGWLAYCSKERVTQARWVGGVGKLAKRRPGSHSLGAGGGDRVRLSKALMAELLDEGLITPYQRRYAARSLPKPTPTPSIVYRETLFDGLPTATAPAKAVTMPHPRLPLAPPTLPLLMAPTIAELLSHLGPTHAAIAERVGLSRPQVTNVINGQFGASRHLARKVLELAKAAQSDGEAKAGQDRLQVRVRLRQSRSWVSAPIRAPAPARHGVLAT